MDRLPITRAAMLNSLDNNEVVEGYFDGIDNSPEPGDNRSYSYWHGWRNGMVDGGFRNVDQYQAELARDFLEQN